MPEPGTLFDDYANRASPARLQEMNISKDLTMAADLQNIDYASTFTEMASARIPDGLHGRSIVPILRGETPQDWRKSVYYRYYDKNGAHNVANHDGLRTDRYTLAYYDETDEWELFDNKKDPKKDPHQLRSVYDNPAYAKTLAALQAELRRLRVLYQDSD